MKFTKEILKNQRGLKSSMGDPLTFKKEDYDEIVKNFKPGKVWIPYTHSSDPRDNTGFVKKVWHNEDSDSIWALMDVVDEDAIERINSKMVQDVSVSLKKDEKRGWMLKHVALTLDPALKGQKPFKEMEEGEYRIELTDLQPFVEVSGDKGEIMADKDKETVEDKKEEKEEVNLEEAKSLIAKVREMIDFAGKNKELTDSNKTLAVELEERDKRITDLEAVVTESKETLEALMEDARKKEWEAVFESHLGKRCVPAEKELLGQRISDPEALKVELEARADIGVTEKKIDELDNEQKDDFLSRLTEAELAFVKERKWDLEENEKYLKAYLAQLEEQKA